jgi:hypothetical protein
MNWKRLSKHCLSSEEGYLISKYAMEVGHAYVSRCPKEKILLSGKDLDKAKAACVEHLSQKEAA